MQSHPLPPTQIEKKQGFAVIIALSLMAFIVLLLLSMTTLVQVETRTADIGKEQLKARQNALLGAYVALGNLQRHAGPDQRITSTGDILGNTDATKAKLTGIWDSDPNSPTYGQAMEWLVSRDPDAAFAPDTFNTSATAVNDIELVSARRVGLSDEIEAVRATPIEVLNRSGAAAGQFAWWVGDEGVKASIGLPLPGYEGLSAQEIDLAQIDAASRYAPEVITDLSTVTDPNQWSKITERSDAGILSNLTTFQEAVTDNFHDLTARSFSVLTNVKDGGLKKDLTAGLVAGRNLMEDDLGYDGLFPPQWGGPTSVDPGGPLWEQMRDFYSTRVSGTGAGTINVRTASRNNDTVSITPVITWLHTYVHALPINGGSQVRFYLLPAIALWNPYQHNLSMPSCTAAFDLFDPQWAATDDLRTAIARSSFDRYLLWELPSYTFAPGEVQMFTMVEHETYSTSSPATLQPGWRDGLGVYQDVAVIDEATSTPAQVTGDISLAHIRATGNAYFYLSTSDSNFDNTSFYEMRRLVLWGNPDPNGDGTPPWRKITGSGSASAPTGNLPLVASTHGSPLPRIGYPAAAKFASASIGMTWIGAPEESTHLAQYNIRSSFSSRSPSELLQGGGTGAYNTNPLYTSGFISDDTFYSAAGNFATGYSASFGPGIEEAGYFQFFRDDLPVVSLGQFMHAELTYTNKHTGSSPSWLFSNYQPAYVIGNSLADPRIPNNETFRDWDDFFGYRDGTHYDQSYLQNEALWDRFFLSGLPRDGERFEAGADGDNVLDQDDFDEGANLRLPNPRLTLIGTPPILEMAGDNSSDPDLDSYGQAAKHLLNDGALNINSTSKNAWQALFAAFYNENVRTLGPDEVNLNLSPITRTTVPLEGPFQSNSAEDPESQSGFRRLNAAEIENLADSLITAIRNRVAETGRPFLSKSEFLNRSITSSQEEHRLKGVMQEALDNSIVNDDISNGEDIIPDSGQSLANLESNNLGITGIESENIQVNKSFGLSAYLMAADMFAKFGHMLNPRSDTFTIRSYGAANDPLSGVTNSLAHCELVVQRLPDPVDVSDDDIDPTGIFGRRFEILSIRWLDTENI